MGLGVWFNEDLAHVLRGAGEAVTMLIASRGLQDGTDAAFVAGYQAALRTVAVSLGLDDAQPIANGGRRYSPFIEAGEWREVDMR